MKKIDLTQASAIVGGTTTCVNSFELNVVGGKQFCNAVKTCTDKNGNVSKDYTPTDILNCPQVG